MPVGISPRENGWRSTKAVCGCALPDGRKKGAGWWNLNPLAKVAGGIWFVIGLGYVGIKTRGFRTAPVMIDFAES